MELLPEETILEICEQMDLSELAKFTRTSKTHKRICEEVLQQRRAQFIQEVLDIASSRQFDHIELYSGKNRRFQLSFNNTKLFPNIMVTSYILEEIFIDEISIIKKMYEDEIIQPIVTRTVDTVMHGSKPITLGIVLNKLIDAGYLNGKYDVFKSN